MSCSLSHYESGVGTALASQTFNVNLHNLQLCILAEAVGLAQQFSVLGNDGIATVNHILCALSKSATRIYIGGNGACALLSDELTQIFMLANEFVARRKIYDDVGTSQSEIVAWWNR